MQDLYRLTNVVDPVNAQDVATKNWVESTFAGLAGDNLGNHTASTTINANEQRIINMQDATGEQDAMNQRSCDARYSLLAHNHTGTYALLVHNHAYNNLSDVSVSGLNTGHMMQ